MKNAFGFDTSPPPAGSERPAPAQPVPQAPPAAAGPERPSHAPEAPSAASKPEKGPLTLRQLLQAVKDAEALPEDADKPEQIKAKADALQKARAAYFNAQRGASPVVISQNVMAKLRASDKAAVEARRLAAHILKFPWLKAHLKEATAK